MRRLAHDNLKRDTRLGYSDVPLTRALYPERQTAVSPSSMGSAAVAWRNVKCVCVCVREEGSGFLDEIHSFSCSCYSSQILAGFWLPHPSFCPFKSGQVMAFCRFSSTPLLCPAHIHGPWYITCFFLTHM